MTEYDPEQHLHDLASQLGYEVSYERMRFLGLTHFEEKWVKIDPRPSHSEQRSTMAHEAVHLERGPFPKHREQLEERTVEHIAARRLIDLDDLIEALRWSDSTEELAEELGVFREDVLRRIQGLTPAEGARLDRALPAERRRRRLGRGRKVR